MRITCQHCRETFLIYRDSHYSTWEEKFQKHVKICEERSLGMTQDPLIRATRKAYRSSDTYKLDQLLAEESRWKRKVTIASNKLLDVRERINRLAKELAGSKTEKSP